MTDSLLFIKYGAGFLLTVNPPSRRVGGTGWDCGAGDEWCHVSSEAELRLAGLLAAQAEATAGRPIGGGRIDRQATLHGLLGFCTRPAPHWPVVQPANSGQTTREAATQDAGDGSGRSL